MDMRGGTPPNWQMGQVGGQQAAAAVPSLLQMAQGDMPGGLQRGGAENAYDNGTAWGNAQIGAPPAWAEQGSPHAFPDIYKSQPGGGWFTMDDYYAQAPKDDRHAGMPHQFQSGSSLPSTNNWQLLPENWRVPGNFMINGQIISRAKLAGDTAPKVDPYGVDFKGYFGTNDGFPFYRLSSNNAASHGYLGQVTPMTTSSTSGG